MMGSVRWVVVVALTLIPPSTSSAQSNPATVPVPAPAPLSKEAAPAASSPTAESTNDRHGLVLPTPYTRGKVPVIFIHGLWMNVSAWNDMIGKLRADPVLDARFQFWTFGYATGDPIPYAALLLRRAMRDARARLDPEGTDPAFDRTVLVGHSMGGLLAKMMVVRSDDHLWRVFCSHPTAELQGDAGDREYLTEALIFDPRAEVRRVVFIATPHRGSRTDTGSLQRLGNRLVRISATPLGIHRRMVERNGPDFFSKYFSEGLPTSVEELRSNGPLLTGLVVLPIDPAVRAHSIIAIRPNSRSDYATDGLVTADSARIDGVASEKTVRCAHVTCLTDDEVRAEVRRILQEHLANP